MPHTHTGFGEHDLTASAFVIRDDLEEPQLLLHMHKKLNVLLQFGGHVEITENPWQGIQHELREESGYTFEEVEVLQPKDKLRSLSGVALHPTPITVMTHPFNEDKSHLAFGFIAHAEPSLPPKDNESKDLRWFTYEQLTDLDATKIPKNVQEIGQYVLTTVFSTWERSSATDF
jgi:8-oxo-dGTP diphosphatase